ncbi:xylan 1,4-beta-xylosidase [Streptomyces sp. AJS327]|uniref:xylan 1,4-beta-xylosidase n=1 Tax=Streptomyces sp. AJS327 TaxID=2545265 RepID=UPI0015DF65F5|nr:xylan 1,4-beta-xylosidase [Streptomyces sp. AJS327]MBA0050585.1 xylan 1,4-beta-xylosidase [Streptomyces sp. AJS327]
MHGARPRSLGLLAAGVAMLALSLALILNSLPGGGRQTDRVHGGPRAPTASPRPELGWGLTHTQVSADQGEPAARKRAARLLADAQAPQNQHIMGWGAENPEPSPGEYDFAALDSRVELMRRGSGTPVLTLCCAPDWMKGGTAGETDWDELETAPRPEHYGDFAALAARVAERYPDIRHFVVWNELKGFYDDDRGRWDSAAYTRLYNTVYRALKKVNRANLVGGPYVVMDSVDRDDHHASRITGPWGALDQRALDAVAYWSDHHVGADFAVVDASTYTRDDRLSPDEFGATGKLTTVGRWVRERTGLPLWWAEWYVEPDGAKRWSEPRRRAVHAAALIAMARGGATTGLYWNPQRRGARCPGCLWRATHLPDGGGGTPLMALLARFQREFPPGTEYRSLEPEGPDAGKVRALADRSAVLVVNTAPRRATVRVAGERLSLRGHQVRWLRR